MTATVLEEIASKWACPICDHKRIITTCQANQFEPKRFMISKTPSLDGNPKIKERMFHHCLNCGYEFSENEAEKDLRENKKEEGDQPWATGGILLILMLATILAIRLTDDENRQPTSTSFQHSEHAELLAQREPSLLIRQRQ